jgi:AcrR family transcriptional regulator
MGRSRAGHGKWVQITVSAGHGNVKRTSSFGYAVGMQVSAEDVRHRILVAARSEFATFGLAGARVDRIAREAHASKERLYAHFTDKVALFDAVLELNSAEFFGAVALRAEDPAAFVGDLFDHAVSSPKHVRMLTWARLEGRAGFFSAGNPNAAANLDALRAAQRLGTADTSWDPEMLLTLLFATGLAWAQSPKPHLHDVTDAERARQRAASVEAAARLLHSPTA